MKRPVNGVRLAMRHKAEKEVRGDGDDRESRYPNVALLCESNRNVPPTIL